MKGRYFFQCERWEGREEEFIDSIGDTFLKGRLRELYNENRLR